MKCFNHPERNAIGTCKACNKGLCHECATDLDHGIACKNKHEKEVNDVKMIIDKSTKIYNEAPKNTLIAPLFYLFMGFVFSWFGYTSKGGVTDLPFIMGIGFIIFGIIVLIRNRAIFNKNAYKMLKWDFGTRHFFCALCKKNAVFRNPLALR